MITITQKRAIKASEIEDNVANYREYFLEVLPLVNHRPGSLVECGFGGGKTANLFIDLIADGLIRKRSVHLYDSFEGFPLPSEEDKSKRNPQKGEWARPIEKALDVKARAATLEIPVSVNKGFFEDTTKDYSGSAITILHIDCDLYQSYKTVLETLYDKVNPGGLIMFDEYGEGTKWPGAVKAIDEFFQDKNVEFFKYDFPEYGKYCMIKP